MDSFKVQAVNMPQTSGHKQIAFGDVASAGTYTFDWRVPRGAIVDKVVVVRPTAFNSSGACGLTVGDVNTANKFLASLDLKGSAARSETLIGKQMQPVSAYTGGSTGDNEYIVRATVTVASGTNSAGTMYIWFDYRFDPNSAYVTKTYGETSVTEA